MKEVGIDGMRPHDLRHTGNTLAAMTGASTKELMARFGQSTPRAALIYQHATQDRDKEIADALNGMIEARLAHHEPLAVNHHAASQDEAFRGASEKLKRVLESTLGKLRDHRSRDSIRREPDPGAV